MISFKQNYVLFDMTVYINLTKEREEKVLINTLLTRNDIPNDVKDELRRYKADLEQTSMYRGITHDTLILLNQPGNLKDSIVHILEIIKERTGFDAVGIRLQEGEDFPYLAQEGFSKDFLLTENTLTERNPDNSICKNCTGKIQPECICGLVISGKTDATNPLFTKGGSFWTNDSSKIQNLPAEQALLIHPRNICISQGYASIALIPIRGENRIVGLIQLNDRRKDCFVLEQIELIENIAAHIGEALQRKKIEEILRQTETRMEGIISGTQVGTWEWNVQTGTGVINELWATMLGYTLNELSPINIKKWEELTHPDDIANAYTFAREHCSGRRRHYDFEYRMKHKNGHWVWVHDRGCLLIRSPDGKPHIMFGTHTDITARKQLEIAETETKERYQKLFMEAPIGIALIDSNTGRFCEINSMYAKIAGRTIKEMLQIEWMTITYADDIKEDQENMDLLNAGKIKGYEIRKRYVRPDKSIVWVAMTITSVKVDNTDQPRHLCMIKDIREQMQAEKKEIEKQRLEAIGQMTDGIAHNMNNVLQTITMEMELGLRVPGIPQTVIEGMRNVLQSSRNAASDIKQLQRFSRKSITCKRQAIDLNELIEASVIQTRSLWKSATEKLGLRITIQLSLGSIKSIDGDQGEISIALHNIIKNAVEAMPKGGIIFITTCMKNENVSLCIKDNGIGMNEETRKRVLEPYFTTKGFTLGRGIGMSSVFNTIKSHNGHINIYSELSKGTTIELLFPTGELEQVTTQRAPTIYNRQTARILWVDDDQTIRNIGAKILRQSGHSVDTASGGNGALALLKESTYDLLITDIAMPDMSGLDLAKDVRGKYGSMKVVTISGYGDNEMNDEKTSGVNYSLGKPIDMEALQLLILEILRMKQ